MQSAANRAAAVWERSPLPAAVRGVLPSASVRGRSTAVEDEAEGEPVSDLDLNVGHAHAGVEQEQDEGESDATAKPPPSPRQATAPRPRTAKTRAISAYGPAVGLDLVVEPLAAGAAPVRVRWHCRVASSTPVKWTTSPSHATVPNGRKKARDAAARSSAMPWRRTNAGRSSVVSRVRVVMPRVSTEAASAGTGPARDVASGQALVCRVRLRAMPAQMIDGEGLAAELRARVEADAAELAGVGRDPGTRDRARRRRLRVGGVRAARQAARRGARLPLRLRTAPRRRRGGGGTGDRGQAERRPARLRDPHPAPAPAVR